MNPKDIAGAKKVAMGLFPATGKIYGALACEYGAGKYGPYNWRDSKVQVSAYLDAMERHILAFRDGEDRAEDSGLPHLAHIIGGAGILADALESGLAIDDRPAKGSAALLLEKYAKTGASDCPDCSGPSA